MSVVIKTTIRLIDDEDEDTISVEPIGEGGEDRRWSIHGSGMVCATAADLREFAEAILKLISAE